MALDGNGLGFLKGVAVRSMVAGRGFMGLIGCGFPVVVWVGFMWLEVVVVRGGLVWIFLVRVLMDSQLVW